MRCTGTLNEQLHTTAMNAGCIAGGTQGHTLAYFLIPLEDEGRLLMHRLLTSLRPQYR